MSRETLKATRVNFCSDFALDSLQVVPSGFATICKN
jgi:hypothetical protein